MGGPQWNQSTTATDFSTASDKCVYFGLGAATEARVEIAWPSGVQHELVNAKPDRALTVREEGAVSAALTAKRQLV